MFLKEETLFAFNKIFGPILQLFLYPGGRILCWIPITTKNSSLRRAQLIKKTWGRKCDLLLFKGPENSISDPSLSLIALPMKESYAHLWGITKEALKHIHDYYLDKADWFFKADDDT